MDHLSDTVLIPLSKTSASKSPKRLFESLCSYDGIHRTIFIDPQVPPWQSYTAYHISMREQPPYLNARV